MAASDQAPPDLHSLEHRWIEAGLGEQRLHFTGQAQWQEFWRRFNQEPAPAVDFKRHDLLMFLLGTRGSDGYSVHLNAVRRTSSCAQIEIVTCSPPAGRAQVAVLTSPYFIKLVDKIETALTWVVRQGRPSAPPCV